MAKITDPITLNAFKNSIRNGTLSDEALKDLLEKGKLDAKELIADKTLTQERYDRLYYVSPEEKAKIAQQKQREADEIAERERQVREAEANKIRDEIEGNIKNGSYSDDDIIDFCEKGILDIDELVNRRVITKNKKDSLFPSDITVPFQDWESIPPLLPNRVDVLFLGIARAGKSSLMAGLLRYGEKTGNMTGNIHNQSGSDYMHILINAVKRGQTPPPTSLDHMQYMNCDFTDKNKNTIPMTLIDMSGERLHKIVGKNLDQIEHKLQVKLKEYFLENTNRKVIFLAVDYDAEFANDAQKSQNRHFDNILLFFEKYGMMAQTVEAIVLVVTKWDKCVDGSTSEQFLKDNNLGLITLCKKFEKKYGVTLKIIEFSLGTFKPNNEKRYVYNEEYSKRVFNLLCDVSPYLEEKKSKVGFFKNLFKTK